LALLMGLGLAIPAAAMEPSILPGGCVIIPDDRGNVAGECPLEHTDVEVEIAGFIARVTLTQRFANPFKDPIEAVYTFPMSEKSAVDTMLMKVGDRVIKGIIKERSEAERIYREARDAGKTASLLDQERPNIFTQSVANIMPGDAIEITISYVEYLKYEEGHYEFSFPMVVGPRYIPDGGPTPVPDPDPVPLREPLPDRSGVRPAPLPYNGRYVPDANRITPPVTPKGTRTGHDISLTVNLNAGMAIRDIESVLHEVDVKTISGNEAVIHLQNQMEIPNRDFVLKYTVAGEGIEDAVLTHTDSRGGFVSFVLQPPARLVPEAITPKEMIFVIDVSGSMRGFPIEKAKSAMRQCIEGMNPHDTFNLVTFAGGLGYCFDSAVPNTPQNRAKALEYLANLEGGGGTEMMQAIHAALGNQNDPERLRVVCFMTDGFIGNDMAILDAIRKNVNQARVFAFGIGSSVNRFLIEGMGREGRGASEVITLESDGDEAAQRFHARIQSPVLTDISIAFDGLPVTDLYPAPNAIPDLFASQPIVLTGRYTGRGKGTVTICGNTAQGPFERAIPIALPGDEPANDVLASLWARQRIEWLMAEDWLGAQVGNPKPAIKQDIIDLGLEFSLVTQYTSFVAVEERVVNENGRPRTIQVPVEMPDGVSYEGIFGEGESPAQFQTLGKSGRAAGAVPMSSRALSDRSQPMRQEAPALQPREVAADESRKPASEPEVDKDVASKLAPELRGLAAKVRNGNYTEGAVKVRNGVIQVHVKVALMDAATAKALRDVGARIVAEMHSDKTFYVAIPVEALDRLAALEGVLRVEPPTS
jgi:Ca-activated chloride channel family protein